MTGRRRKRPNVSYETGDEIVGTAMAHELDADEREELLRDIRRWRTEATSAAFVSLGSYRGRW